LFVKRDDIKILDMTPEEGAKMIISGGMVSSNQDLDITPPPKSKVPKPDGPSPLASLVDPKPKS